MNFNGGSVQANQLVTLGRLGREWLPQKLISNIFFIKTCFEVTCKFPREGGEYFTVKNDNHGVLFRANKMSSMCMIPGTDNFSW